MNVYLNNRQCYLIVEFLLGVRLEAALTLSAGSAALTSISGLAAAVTRESQTPAVYLTDMVLIFTPSGLISWLLIII